MPNTEVTLEDNSDTFEKIESFSRSIESATNRPTTELNKQLIYKLDWSTRDAIIFSLSHYTQMLYGGKTEIALAKDKLVNGNLSLYQSLLKLPPKSDDDASAEGRGSKRITLDLDSAARSQIINTLLENHSLVLCAKSASEESKMKMIEQNNDLVVKLAKLPFSISFSSADESDLDGKWAGGC